jgi:asparagine synthase (glutamine-hydrolysing)
MKGMCGIVGWINTEVDLINQNIIIKKMTDTVSKRGPDAVDFQVNTHALLGHRRLVVVDPEGGAQPMTRQLGQFIYTIIYNGELYNTEELRKMLKDRGHHFKGYSDTEVLLVSYMEWGQKCVDYLNGIYAFGIWEENHKSLFLARDRLGVKPLFYSQRGNHFVFASEIKALLAHPMIEPVIDEEGLSEIFGLGPARSPGNAVFKGIYEVPPGYSLLYEKGEVQLKRYWHLESREHNEGLNETVERVRNLLVDAVERQLVSDVPICTFLSGGLDSSAISAIAAKAFKKEGKGILNTYSIDYVDNDIYFKPSEFQPNSDAEWVIRMKDFIGSNHYNTVIDIESLVPALEDAVKANDLPGMADVDSSLYLFCKEVRKEATVALSGECADEIFGGYPWFRRSEDINGNTFPWSKATKERKEILSKEFNSLDLEGYVASKYEDTLKEVPRLSGESREAHRIREIFYLNLKWFMITLLNRKDRMSMANSLEVRVPFADHRIVEYTWNIPWEMKFYKGREKGLLRKSLEGLLPQEIIERKKSPFPKTHHPAYLKAVKLWMKSILQDPASPILQIINRNRVNEIVETGGASFGKPWFGQLMTGPQLIAYLIQINIWMKEYNVKVL